MQRTVEIIADGPTGFDTRVVVDGKEVEWVTRCEIVLTPDGLNEVTLTLLANRVVFRGPAEVVEVESAPSPEEPA